MTRVTFVCTDCCAGWQEDVLDDAVAPYAGSWCRRCGRVATMRGRVLVVALNAERPPPG